MTGVKDVLQQAFRAWEEQERQDAEAAGMTLEQWRANVEAVEAAKRREEEREALQAARKRRLTPMLPGLPASVANAIIRDELRPTKALDVVRRWLRNPEAPPILVLVGGYGSGKTVAAGWALATHYSGTYVRAVDFAMRAEPYTNDLSRGVTPLDVKRPALLILDDLGTERRKAGGEPDPRFAPALYDVFDQRLGTLQNGQPRRTLITTNLGKEAFIKRYAADERNVSRLRRDAYFAPCGNVDLRRTK